MSGKKKQPEQVKLPPVGFSNAMNFIYDDWDFRGWETSKEWRLWNAGREDAYRDVSSDAKMKADDAMRARQ